MKLLFFKERIINFLEREEEEGKGFLGNGTSEKREGKKNGKSQSKQWKSNEMGFERIEWKKEGQN